MLNIMLNKRTTHLSLMIINSITTKIYSTKLEIVLLLLYIANQLNSYEFPIFFKNVCVSTQHQPDRRRYTTIHDAHKTPISHRRIPLDAICALCDILILLTHSWMCECEYVYWYSDNYHPWQKLYTMQRERSSLHIFAY